jgi:hypothetical protein
MMLLTAEGVGPGHTTGVKMGDGDLPMSRYIGRWWRLNLCQVFLADTAEASMCDEFIRIPGEAAIGIDSNHTCPAPSKPSEKFGLAIIFGNFLLIFRFIYVLKATTCCPRILTCLGEVPCLGMVRIRSIPASEHQLVWTKPYDLLGQYVLLKTPAPRRQSRIREVLYCAFCIT